MRLDSSALARVRLWIEKADEDLRAAEILRASPDASASVVGFHVQQAIEKALKGYLVACRRFPGKVHDLGLLAARAALLDAAFARHVEALEPWTHFAVEERYPMDWPGGAPPDLDAGIALARQVRDLAADRIAGELPDPGSGS